MSAKTDRERVVELEAELSRLRRGDCSKLQNLLPFLRNEIGTKLNKNNLTVLFDVDGTPYKVDVDDPIIFHDASGTKGISDVRVRLTQA